jgi:hypothetical protein
MEFLLHADTMDVLWKSARRLVSRVRPPKSVTGVVALLSALLTVLRLLVLFLEEYSRVSSERSSDDSLITLCRADAGQHASGKLRAACLQAVSDRASPAVLKALLQAFAKAFEETKTSLSSVQGVFAAVLFLCGSLATPARTIGRRIALHRTLPALRSGPLQIKATDSDDDDDSDEDSFDLSHSIRGSDFSHLVKKRAFVVDLSNDV